MRMKWRFGAVALLASACCAATEAQTSANAMTLQGRLSGVADGTQSLQIRFYSAQTGGTLVATTPAVNASVSGGIFSAVVTPPASAFNGQTLWWVAVVGGSELGPRQLVTTVPYALRSSSIVDDRGYALIANGLGTARLGVNTTPSALVHIQQFEQDPAAFWVEGKVDNEPAPPVALITMLDIDHIPYQGGGVAFLEKTGESTHYLIKAYFNDQNKLTLSNTGELWLAGRASVPSLEIRGGSDLAEPFPASPAGLDDPRPGMILSIDPDHAGSLRVATEAYDTKVAGVYSGANGLRTGMLMGQDGCPLTGASTETLPLAMTGRVWVYADESNGVIRPGDRLTTSGEKAGCAMRATDAARADGAVIGKAMTAVDPESGMVMVLVNLQ